MVGAFGASRDLSQSLQRYGVVRRLPQQWWIPAVNAKRSDTVASTVRGVTYRLADPT